MQIDVECVIGIQVAEGIVREGGEMHDRLESLEVRWGDVAKILVQ
jgi:hypothetical protein